MKASRPVSRWALQVAIPHLPDPDDGTVYSTPGKLTGVMATAVRNVGGGYVPLHVGAAVKQARDQPRKRGVSAAGTENSRASLRANPTVDSDHQTVSGRRASLPESRQLRRDGSAG